MKTSHPTLRPLVFVSALSGLSAGCAGPARSDLADVKPTFVAADYEQGYFTGSHIPVLVPKDPGIRRIPTIFPLVILEPDEMQRAAGPTPFPMHRRPRPRRDGRGRNWLRPVRRFVCLAVSPCPPPSRPPCCIPIWLKCC